MAASNSRSSSTLASRKGIATNKMSKPQASNLQILLQMGFPKHRAEKALAATGNRSAELATKWLLAHVNDPFIDDNSPREYILYACPKGPLLNQLKQFWEKSLYLYGWNGAHNFTPHITLVSFFKTPDEDAPHLVKSLESVMERDGAVLNETLKLETYTSPNFMGFFVAEDHADYLKRIAMQFVKEVSNAIISDTYEHFDALTACFPWCTTTTARCIPRGSRSISLEPHVKSLHLTLAYQFPSSQYNCLKGMVDELDSSASGEWELRLYSRDPRLNGKQVYKVIRDYKATECDDLELEVGDYVYVSSEAFNNSATDRWLEGTSWLTGCSGFFPESYTVRTAESEAWALHTSIPLNILGSDTESKNDMGDDSLGLQQIKKSLKNLVHLADFKNVNAPDIGTSDNDARKIFIMRHGERVDFVFGNWVQYSFDESGNYIRKDLNMPESLPTRNPGPEAYVRDGPVTNVGLFQAKLIGKFFKEKNIDIQHVYSSPSFRCLQTCDSFLKGLEMKDKLKIRVDPSLFEWLHWYPEQFPMFMSEEEQISAGFNVDTEYTPYMSHEQLSDNKESCATYYERSAGFTKKILETYPSGNVLIVGHASTLDTCSRELVTGRCRNADSLFHILQKIPYCSLAQFTYDGTNLHCTEPPCPSITHSTNTRFDWKVLLSD